MATASPKFVLVATADVPEVGAVAGDSILVRPGTEDPLVVLHRPCPAFLALAASLEEGAVEAPTCATAEALDRLRRMAAERGEAPTPVLRFGRRGPRLLEEATV